MIKEKIKTIVGEGTLLIYSRDSARFITGHARNGIASPESVINGVAYDIDMTVIKEGNTWKPKTQYIFVNRSRIYHIMNEPPTPAAMKIILGPLVADIANWIQENPAIMHKGEISSVREKLERVQKDIQTKEKELEELRGTAGLIQHELNVLEKS